MCYSKWQITAMTHISILINYNIYENLFKYEFVYCSVLQ